LGKSTKATWSAERMGGTDPNLSDTPKRYDCCVVPDYVPSDGECLPNCKWHLNIWGGKGKRCGKTCCHSHEVCVNGECRQCESLGGHSCLPAEKGATVCCAKGTTCCFNKTTTACCGPKQTCHAQKGAATCSCDKGKKCGSDCCTAGETCCGGKECCGAGETCTGQGCCPKGRATCGSSDGTGRRVCCDEGEYCFWKFEDELAPLSGTCKRGCAPGNRAGTQCCGTGYKPNKPKTACVPE
jgi:hypothetical protein